VHDGLLHHFGLDAGDGRQPGDRLRVVEELVQRLLLSVEVRPPLGLGLAAMVAEEIRKQLVLTTRRT
jgi:hypothetical protein